MLNEKNIAMLIGRILMASLFLWAGVHKFQALAGTTKYLANLNVPLPEITVWIVVAIEVLGGLAILIGFQTRWVALGLALFCLVTGFWVHLPVGDQANMINFYKNLAMAGGFLFVYVTGAGALSVDKDKS